MYDNLIQDDKQDGSIDPIKKMALIKKQAFFSKLSEKELDVLASLFSEYEVYANDVLVSQGDEVDSVFIIVDGTADVRITLFKNNIPDTKSVATLGPGNAIGLNETGFYSITGKRTATVVAKTNMLLLRLSVAAFHGFALAYPQVNELMRKNSGNVL